METIDSEQAQDDSGSTLAAAVREQAARLVLHDAGTRAGEDPEELHQMRVATRRLRAFLRAGAPLVDAGWARALRDDLGRLGRLLGEVRDRDVLLERLRAEANELDPSDRDAFAVLLAAIERERESARAELLTALDGDDYRLLLERLERGEVPLTGEATPLRAVWERELRRTRTAAAVLDETSPDEALHALRIRVKRARYAAELARPELGRRGAAFVDAAKALQDVLGEHQDAVVAEETLRRLAADAPPAAALAAGRLVERERARRRDARRDWPAAWRAFARRAKAAGA